MTTVYARIARLVQRIKDETGVTKRRSHCADLRELLTSQRNQEMLLQEAKSKEALSAVWATILRAAVVAAERANSKKGAKYTKEDIAIPYYMLLRLDEFSKFVKMDSLLSTQQVRELLVYCVSLLSNEKACEVAEAELLNMLEHMCSRPDYVAHFRVHSEMENILAELEPRLENLGSAAQFGSCAKVFYTLLATAKMLGIGMQRLMTRCLDMMECWCKDGLRAIYASEVKLMDIVGLDYMFGAAAAILSRHPEHAIFDFSTKGSSFLKLAKKCYPNVATKRNKEALIEYFLAHLLVCQTAGKLQGLLPGDLGDVGKASLDNEEIAKLLEMTITEHEISKVRMGSDVTMSQTKGPRHSQTTLGTREASMEPTDLSRHHFELCARLLACSQRQYLSDAEWEAIGNPEDAYIEAIPSDPHPEMSCMTLPTSSSLKSCSQSDFINSPWISRVGLPLWSFCDNLLTKDASQVETVATQDASFSTSSLIIGSQDDIRHLSSVLRDMSEKMYDEAPKSPVPFLQLVCACAETFPMGQCWMSNSHRNWNAYTPEDMLSEDKAYCNSCSPDDIALVISLVTNILEAFGSPNGNVQTQRWALTCLIRLAESSALVAFASEQRGEWSHVLHVVWRRVWNIIFRADLRYTSYTRNASNDTLGELVLVLLTEIVKRRCADATITGDKGNPTAQHSIGEFVYANQMKVWCLDAFSNGALVRSQAVFDLTNAILRHAGLSEDGKDLIDGAAPMTRPTNWDGIETSSRRCRLVALCLRYLESTIPTCKADGKSGYTEAAIACLVTLITGKSTSCLSVFDRTASIGYGNHYPLNTYFCVTNIPVDRREQCHPNSSATFSTFFQAMWNDQIDALPKSWLQGSNLPSTEFDDSELTISRHLNTGRQLLGDRHRDFVSPATASALHTFVTDILIKMSSPPSDTSNGDLYEFDDSTMTDAVSNLSVASMVQRISALKLLMTVAFSSADDDVIKQTDMELIEGHLNSLFDDFVDHFPSAEQHDGNCGILVSSLLQVLHGLSTISLSIDGPSIPETVSARLKSLFNVCKRMVDEYSRSRELAASSGTSNRQKGAIKFLDSDEEPEKREEAQLQGESDGSDDDSPITGSKRRRPANSYSHERKRTRSSLSSNGERYECPNSDCVNRLASILVLLQPSYGVCRLVADAIALPRTEAAGVHRSRDTSCEVDVNASLHCLNLFCSPFVIHRDQTLGEVSAEDDLSDSDSGTVRNGTIVSLCCELIQAIRTASGSGSQMRCFGFEVCADLVYHREKEGGRSLDSSERHALIDLLLPNEKTDRKLLKGMPEIRARQVTAATSVFRDAQQKMHQVLDPQFKKEIIAPCLAELSASVRKKATMAVGAALQSFTQQANIVNGITKHLPPLLPNDDSSLSGQFHKWWESDKPALAPESPEDNIWKGAFFALQSFAVETKGIIVASTTSKDIFCKCLFDLVLLAAERSDLEALCYHACEKAANMAGFDTVQRLLMSESEYICGRWLETGIPFENMPLLFTAPTVLFKLLQSGSAKFLFRGGAIELSKTRAEVLQKDKRSKVLEEVRKLAAHEYVARSAYFLVPIICIRKARHSSEDERRVNGYLEEAAEMTVSRSGTEGTKTLLTVHFPHILAVIEPFLYCVDQRILQDGQNVVSYLKKTLSDDYYNKLRRKTAKKAIHQLLQNWGKSSEDFEKRDVSEEVVSEAIMVLAQEGTTKVVKEPFAAIGSSVTECILYSRFWLSESVLDRQKERRWSAFQLIFPVVLKYVRSASRLLPKSQLGFCIHTILDILADESMSGIHCSALKSLNALLATVLSLECASQYSSEISPVFYRLVGTLVTVHEWYQDKLIEDCLSSWKKQRRLEHSSSGLLLTAKSSRSVSGSAWGWEDEQEKRIKAILEGKDSIVKVELYDTLAGTYDALASLFENAKTLRGSAAVPFECLSKFASKVESYSSLCSRNEKYCARSLVSSFLAVESSEKETTENRVSTFLKVSRTLLASHLGSPSKSQERDESISESACISQKDRELNTDFRLLVDELHHVQVSLEQSCTSPMEVSTRADIDLNDRYSLVNLLLKLCEVSFPEGVRSAASRCLGALGPSDIEMLASAELELSENESQLFLVAQEDGNLLSRIKGSCLEMLSRFLLSPRPETAIAALEASRAILASKDASDNFEEHGDCKRLLDPLIRTKQSSSKPNPSAFAAPDGYLENMLAKITMGDVELTTKDDLSWCWHEVLWMAGRNGALSFEDWVKFITCSMISCCFVGDDEAEMRGRNESIRGSGMFFRYCIKLCALEHEFASKAFSGIVLDLLFSGSECGHLPTTRGKQPQTLANQYLSRCFATLIEPANEGESLECVPRIRALSLAVDTIDMLRFMMQKRFDQSKHKRNFGAVEPSLSASGQSDRNRIQNGVILHLNGLSVARACMQANRFASALFYADMHAEMCYGSAGRILERMANREAAEDVEIVNISGFDHRDGSHRSSTEADSNRSRASNGKHMLPLVLGQSFTALCDNDAADAVKMESAAMSFLDDRFKWNTGDSLQFEAVERLPRLDLQCQVQNGRIMAGQQLLDDIESIGLDSAMQTYTGQLVGRSGTLSGNLPLGQDALRERWFCDRILKSMEWDGEIFTSIFAQEPQNQTGSSVPAGSRVGFHEGLSKALSSFMKHDSGGFWRALSLARGSLIDDLSCRRQGEAPLRSLISAVEKLQFLNDIENLDSIESCKIVASKWQTQNEAALGSDVVASPLTTTSKAFRLNEVVMSFREVMLRSFQARKTTANDDLKGNLVSHLWHISAVARLVGRVDLADCSVRRLHTALHQKYPTGLDDDKLLRVRFEEAMIMESRGEFSSAIRGLDLLSSRLKELKLGDDSLPPPFESLFVDALLTCGEWMSRYKVQPGRIIMDEYLTPAAKLADTIRAKKNDDRAATYRSFAAHLALAKLSSSLFDSVCKIVDSPEWDKAGANITLKDNEIQILEKMITDAAIVAAKDSKGKKRRSSSETNLTTAQKKLRDLEVLLPGKRTELANMRKDFERTKESIPTFLELALESYCQALIYAPNGDSSDISTHVYRFVSLWFDNCDKSDERAKAVNDVMGRMIKELPSFRFVPLAYQIFSRIASGPEEFQTTLNKLVHTMCVEHPYHCIVQLLALSNGKEVGTARGSKEYQKNVDNDKIDCAKSILADVKKSDSVFAGGLVESYSALVQAYIDLALASTEGHAKGSKEVSNIPLSAMKRGQKDVSKALANIKRYSYVPCVISNPPDISPGGHYGDGLEDPKGSERIERFDSMLSISGKGLSVPKFIVCHGTQGGAYKQVVKGNDDVRADAVMQQVFCFVNDLMKRRSTNSSRAVDSVEGYRPSGAGNARALKDQLRIVTYHIVPLSPATGVMEFVKDSIPFGAYCLGTSTKNVGAHSKYYPGEWGYEEAKERLRTATADKKREVYDTVCRNFSPAFRHFFIERFGHSLPLWYAAKMKYTRSCAVNSIVGHMLGIGDRHLYNILIKENTGECVHIDFGVVFEQGKLLLTPETVPFRLTRDIVDGMGPCGTEGTFTRAAEETARLLRQNTSALLTILSAVVSDPLYKWNVTPREARNRQNIERDEGEEVAEVENEVDVSGAEDPLPTVDEKNEAAVRAIARIQEKLQGYEDGTSGERQSVEGQVQLLINEARDEENLSKIFPGWSPFV